MGLHYFETPDPEKSPLEPWVHVTYANSSSSTGNLSGNQTVINEQTLWETHGDTLMSMFFAHLASIGLCFHLFWFSFLWLSLTTRQMVSLYTYLFAFCTVPLSYILNSLTVNQIVARIPLQDAETILPLSLFFGELTWLLSSLIQS